MAQGFLRSFDDRLQVSSAGTEPAEHINSTAVKVMTEAGIDISNNIPENVSQYINEEWDYVITVCDDANEKCPYFPGYVKHRLHMGFEDPSNFRGSAEETLAEFRRTRDEIKKGFYQFFKDNLA